MSFGQDRKVLAPHDAKVLGEVILSYFDIKDRCDEILFLT